MSITDAMARPALAILGMGLACCVCSEERAIPPPPPKVDAVIHLAIERPGQETHATTVRESEVREMLGANVFYDVDAFIATGFKKLRLDSAIECVGVEPMRACTVARIDNAPNTDAFRWRLYCNGVPQKHGINQINWRGIDRISLVFEPIARTP